VAAGRKVSKSCSAAIIALWWFTAWVDAVVVMTSTTGRQLADILWRELRLQFSRSQRRLPVDDPLLQRFQHLRTFPIDGEPSLLAQNGLKSGHRVINGFSAKEGVAAAGISGAHLLYLVDEASGVEQHIFDAIIGNMAGGGGRLVLFGNPTRCEGEFFDAFNTKHAVEGKPGGYHTLTISSEESPNVIENVIIIPGLAYREWIEERKS
jgi:hypothetical protein